MSSRTAYLGRDSNITYQLLDSGIVKDLSNLSQIDLVFGVTTRVKGTSGSLTPIDFTTNTDRMVLKLGAQSISSGSYPNVEVIVYDGDNPSGLVWGTISLVVKANPYTGS